LKKSKKSQETQNSEELPVAVLEGLETAMDASLAFDENDPELLALSEAAESSDNDAEPELIGDTEGLEADPTLTEGSELADFESAEVEAVMAISEEQMASVLESLLFASDKPMSLAVMKAAFQGTKVKTSDLRKALERLTLEYSNPMRGVFLEEVAGGYQLRTKPENASFLKQTVKSRPFKLSGPALEVLSVVAYKQPCTKAMVDEVRGVESGHLMRGLLERAIIRFHGKSDLPGRPMLYETTKKFLEIFGLRNINELPSLNEIEQILPEGIDETTSDKETLGDLTGRLSEAVGVTYSEGEEELTKISDELSAINTSSEFFEAEKKRMKDQADAEKARDLRERQLVGEALSPRELNWLARFDEAIAATQQPVPDQPASVE